MVKIALIVGARPNFMKAIPIYNSLCKHVSKQELYFIHTGQHYTHSLSQVFIDELEINYNDIIYLEKYSKTVYPKESLIDGFSWIIKNLSKLFVNEKIDNVIVFGDVNSTLAAALAAKMNNISLTHVEAGLRSYDMNMPEERNRTLVDRMSDLLFITEISAKENLLKEGINNNVYHCGNTMIDTLKKYLPLVKNSQHSSTSEATQFKYILFTLHRQKNVDNKETLEKIMKSIKNVSDILKQPVLFVHHPRTLKNIEKFNIETGDIVLLKSQSYLNMLKLVYNCGILITDSGGLQEESAYLGVPCVTIRKNTERPLTVYKGYNNIISPYESKFNSLFIQEVISKYGMRNNNIEELKSEMGNGNAADKIVEIILNKI